jgi:hypothetical protein
MNGADCQCKFGHGFSREDAATLQYKCNKDGSPILCKTADAPGGGNDDSPSTSSDDADGE